MEVKLTVRCFPPAEVYLDTPTGLSLLGYSDGEIPVKPPVMRDAEGKIRQYARGELVLRAPDHQDLRVPVTSQDWAAGQLPAQRLVANSLLVTVQDYSRAYPRGSALGLVLALWGVVAAMRWRKAARSTAEEVRELSSQLDTSGDPLIGKLVGRYRVESRLGQGGMGSVYRVRDDAGVYAAKVVYYDELASQMVDRFRREFKLLSQLKHPTFPRCFDYHEGDGMAFCVMELVQGKTLRQVIKREGLPWTTVRPWLLDILDGLATAHAQGIVHRDLKPENIMVNGEEVKILDFGIARQHNVTAITMTGQAFGTPQYIAPEQVYGSSSEIDARTDLYSLGIILFELLAGHPPFQADDVQELISMQIGQPAPLLPETENLPREVGQFVNVLLAKNPANRYSSAGRARAAVEEMGSAPQNEDSTGTVAISKRPAGAEGGGAGAGGTVNISRRRPAKPDC